ncbi:hypothetical protein SAMN04489859_102036 [Paracoccus alcaliphilus]|uniref:Uncharacterized protein n=1 Tax=Paracoccus alcaliphilus TaxID=34002 RepID=A0A1H8K3I5_9RHOB|nr:hypothetical protein [Paracoccus alcaliphilus]WCR17532.1 hypothetical protein JHW40_14515 [Paracoccus alcaliphilus]SEN87522.1 hypothetical protein SAMN04489859_102036 [Paracoccus alcaliphilus]
MTQTRMSFNPTVKTMQFRAWAYCQTHGTNFTIEDLAETLNVQPTRLRRALRDERWSKHLRSSVLEPHSVRTQFDQSQVAASDIDPRRASVGAM